jgi:lipoprotein NlpD
VKFIYLSLLCLFCWSLISCDEVETLAPVTEISTIEAIPKTGIHRVQTGETLYEIAWRYGLDYRQLANHNQIDAPYAIYVGQKIYLKSARKTVREGKPRPIQGGQAEPNYSVTKWRWPTRKSAINRILQSGKGINIFGQLGDPIYAAGPGRVVYAGDGLRGLGNLIILKHNSVYLSAYAYNKTILVKEGDWVKQGQKIAEMGYSGTNKAMLHFEIRRGGSPMVPALWLTNQI